MNPLSDNHYVLFILRLKFDNNQVISASTLQKIDKTSKMEIIEYLYSRILVSNEAYSITPIKSIIFSYGIREGKLDPNVNELSLNSNINTKFQIYYKHKLPIIKSGLINEYGKILSLAYAKDNKYTIFINNSIIILELTYINEQQVNKIKYIKKGQFIIGQIQ